MKIRKGFVGASRWRDEDAYGNEVKLKSKEVKEKKKMMKLIKEKIKNGDELDEDEENYAIEWNL